MLAFMLIISAENSYAAAKEGCGTFTGTKPFSAYFMWAGWEGTLEYSATGNEGDWKVYDTAEVDMESGAGNKLYLRGEGISEFDVLLNLYSKDSDTLIDCEGKLENLLDYKKVAAGEKVTIKANAFKHFFAGNKMLRTAPEMPANAEEFHCYEGMFKNCVNLEKAPALPATKLGEGCYMNMFEGCTSLKEAPELPATEFADQCYAGMFKGCTSLTKPTKLSGDFPKYLSFNGMFEGCKNIKISETKDISAGYIIPYVISTKPWGGAFLDMFKDTGGTFTGTPEVNKEYYLAVREEDKAALAKVTELIDKIPEDINAISITKDKENIEKAKAEYDKLTEEQKLLIEAAYKEKKEKLDKAVAKIAEIEVKKGDRYTIDGNEYLVVEVATASAEGEVKLIKAKNAKNLSVPDSVVLKDRADYAVKSVGAKAFTGKKIRKVTLGANIATLDKKAFNKSKATTIVVKSKNLKKAGVKGALKGSKVKLVQVKVGSKKDNKTYVKKYKKIFTKKICGRKVKVK